MTDDWAEKVYREMLPANPQPVVPPPGCVLCPRCKGTGIGAPGEKYYEMGTGTFGCSECHSYGYISGRSGADPNEGNTI